MACYGASARAHGIVPGAGTKCTSISAPIASIVGRLAERPQRAEGARKGRMANGHETTLVAHLTVTMQENGHFPVNCSSEQELAALLGMQTCDAAIGVYKTALNALGKQAEEHCNLASAMFAEMEPRDGVEAMLVAQMTATHVAMTKNRARPS